eukprot:4400103-Alexandrium_andersonii.AAC.1
MPASRLGLCRSGGLSCQASGAVGAGCAASAAGASSRRSSASGPSAPSATGAASTKGSKPLLGEPASPGPASSSMGEGSDAS